MTDIAKVFIVDDDPTIRDSMRLLLKSVGLASEGFASAEDFLAGYRSHRPACLLADVRMTGMSGLELQRVLKDRGETLPVIVVTGHGDIGMAVQALKDGAVDFIEKPCDEDRVLNSVREALSRATQSEVPLTEIRHRLSTLTDREREVMDLLVEGCLNKVVAARLGISERTVEVHKSRVMQKAGARTLSELIRMALRLEYGV